MLNSEKFLNLIKVCFLAFLALLLVQCGGGSTGTGIKTFSGNVGYDNGSVARAVLVTVVQTGEQSQSDEQGNFSLDTELEVSNSEVIFNANDVESAVPVTGIPAGDAAIEMKVILDSHTSVVSKSEVKVSKKKKKKEDDEQELDDESSSSSSSSSETDSSESISSESEGESLEDSSSSTASSLTESSVSSSSVSSSSESFSSSVSSSSSQNASSSSSESSASSESGSSLDAAGGQS